MIGLIRPPRPQDDVEVRKLYRWSKIKSRNLELRYSFSTDGAADHIFLYSSCLIYSFVFESDLLTIKPFLAVECKI